MFYRYIVYTRFNDGAAKWIGIALVTISCYTSFLQTNTIFDWNIWTHGMIHENNLRIMFVWENKVEHIFQQGTYFLHILVMLLVYVQYSTSIFLFMDHRQDGCLNTCKTKEKWEMAVKLTKSSQTKFQNKQTTANKTKRGQE